MELIFCDLNRDFIDAAREAFSQLDEHRSFTCSAFEDTDGADVLVSAANSFGIMDGGIDLAISEYFGWDLESAVQKRIAADYAGCQPIGTAFIIETGFDDFPHLVHAPTMIVPGDISDTANVYWAMRAILVACQGYESVMCCGLGCGAGEMEPEAAAQQMALAHRHVHELSAGVTWERATRMAQEIASLA